MAFEKTDMTNRPNDCVISHFHSIVIEAIAAITCEEKAGDWIIESRDFYHQWISESPFSFQELFNFILPCPYFHDVNQFVAHVQLLSNQEYLYHFFREELGADDIATLIEQPASYMSDHDHFFWDTHEKKEFVQQFVLHIDNYRSSFSKLLSEINSSEIFLTRLEKAGRMIDQSMNQLKSLTMEPLNLAQYVMGKNFRRVSDYKLYQFIPCAFFVKRRMRVFSSTVCTVIYGCTNPINDRQNESQELEKKIKALSDRNRLLLLSHLSHQKMYGARLSEYLGLTTATISHHLDLLRQAGFVDEEKIGTIKYFVANQDAIDTFFNELKEFLHR